MKRDELKQRIWNAISLGMMFSELETPRNTEAINDTTSSVLAIIASIEDERVAVVAQIAPERVDIDPGFAYSLGFHDATLAAIKTLRQHSEGLTMAPTAYEALRKIVHRFDSLCACFDKFGNCDVSACSEFWQALDEAILAGKGAVSELPESDK
jgi:hypothetical protein